MANQTQLNPNKLWPAGRISKELLMSKIVDKCSKYKRRVAQTIVGKKFKKILQGLETLGLRMDRHCENAQKLAEYLQQHKKVEWVNYATLADSPYNENCKKITSGKASGILSFGITGGIEPATKFIDSLEMILRLVNIGDAKSLACHPASTTHRQLNDNELAAAGVGADLIRISVGIEHIDDIIADVSQALDKA